MDLKPIVVKPKGIIIFTIIVSIFSCFLLTFLFFQEKDIRIFLFLFIFLTLYAIFSLLKRLSLFKLKKDYLKTGFNKYNYEDIKNITLYDTKIIKFLFLSVSEKCLTITLKDGKKVFLLDNYLNNLWQVRWFLENKIIKKKKYFDFNFNHNFHKSEITNKTSHISILIKLIPYIWYSLSFIFLLSTLLLFLGIHVFPWVIISSFLGAFVILMIFVKSNYIESSSEGLIVKNLIFIHRNKKISKKWIDNIHLTLILAGAKGHKAPFLIIKMIYHKEYKFEISGISNKRTENIIAQIKKLNIEFRDYRSYY